MNKMTELPPTGLSITSFKRLFKGDRELDISIMEHSIKNGYITLRGHERVLCGTDLEIAIPPAYRLKVEPFFDIALTRGLIVISSLEFVNPDVMKEIDIIIYNSSPYLSRINLGEKMAEVIYEPIIAIT